MGARLQAAAVLAALALHGALPAAAQSLADIARKEAERRGSTPTPAKTYTNESLTPDFSRPPEPPPATPSAQADRAPAGTVAGNAASATAADPSDTATDADQDGVTPVDQQEPQRPDDKGEEYWRSRATRIRSRLNQQNAEIAALQKRVASFQDGAAGGPERDIATRALRKAQDDLVSLNDEWLRFERQARERNVPDAWIR